MSEPLSIALLLILLTAAIAAIAAALVMRQRLHTEQAARQEAESRLDASLEQSPAAMIVVSGQQVERVNRRFRELFGYARDDLRTLNDWWLRAYPDADYRQQAVETSLEMVAAACQSGTVSNARELRVSCRNGSIKDIEFRYVDLGHVGLWTMNDVTDHYLNEEATRMASDHLLAQLAENQRLHEELKELATRDPLTKLFNRRYLNDTLTREISRAVREGYPVAVMMIDIDHFKRINDTYGHLAGDEMLKSLASHLASTARAEDVVSRFGGEEFAVVLPKMPLNVALSRAEIWRHDFEATPVTFGQFQMQATLSVGIAIFPGNGRTGDHLLDAADRALYVAKDKGRNRIETAEAPHG